MAEALCKTSVSVCVRPCPSEFSRPQYRLRVLCPVHVKTLQKLIPECLEKVKKIKAFAEKAGKPVYIEVDGGVTEENAALVKSCGANVLVAGSAVFKSSDPSKTIGILKGVTK